VTKTKSPVTYLKIIKNPLETGKVTLVTQKTHRFHAIPPCPLVALSGACCACFWLAALRRSAGGAQLVALTAVQWTPGKPAGSAAGSLKNRVA